MDTDQQLREETKAWISEKPRENGEANHSDVHFKQQGFWQRRTGLEKALLVVLFLVIVALVVVVVVLILEQQQDDSSSDNSGAEVCTTRECVSAAARLSSNIDYSVDPCEDFYQFSCGTWMKEYVIPEDMSSYSTFTVLRDNVEVILKNLVEEKIQPSDIEAVQKVKTLYASCMNTSAIDELGDKPLREILNNMTTGWPLIQAGWSDSGFSLEDALFNGRLLGTNLIIRMWPSPDNKNSTRRLIVVDQGRFGMPGQKYLLEPRDEKNLMAYEDYIYNVGELLGFANISTARQEVKDIVDFERELANISVPDEERRDNNKLYNPMTLGEMHGNYSSYFNWRKYIQASVSYEGVGITDVTDDEIIINSVPEYFTRLGKLITNTPNRTIANYVSWRLVQTLISYLGEAYKEPLLIYSKVLFGTSTEKARYAQCVYYVTHLMGLAVGKMFIKDNFDVEAKTTALEMIESLQESFNNQLDQLNWMDDDTKQVAKEKNDYISAKIGYPEEVTNTTYLNDFYSNVTYDESLYFKNHVSYSIESFKSSWRMLRKPVDKNKWTGAPSKVNAYYSPLNNQILFPAGILQPPFFSQTYPKSMNYGGIGVVIGHEITHGFDDRGRQNDKYGNLVQWWSDGAIEKFKEKVQCIVDQYGNFTVTEIDTNLNGVNTQGENLADNGGLKQSFDAYRNWVKKQGKEEQALPGVDFTHNQLFFINFAQLWCNIMRPGFALSAVRTGVHSPGRFRVIGSLQNSEDFAKAFDCPVNSHMNPSKKCRVW